MLKEEFLGQVEEVRRKAEAEIDELKLEKLGVEERVEECGREVEELKERPKVCEEENEVLKKRNLELEEEVKGHESCGKLRDEVERERVKREEAEARERWMKGEMHKAKEEVKRAKKEVKEMEELLDIAGENLRNAVAEKALVEERLEKKVKEIEEAKGRNLQ